MSTLPKPRYSSGSGGSKVRPHPEIQAVPAREPVLSASPSMLGLQVRTPTLPSDPMADEFGVVSHLALRLRGLAALLHRVVRWWMAADFQRCQLPILVLALGVWAITARAAWRSEESATPYLLESISRIRQERARAAAANSGIATARGASTTVNGSAPAASRGTSAVSAPQIAPVTASRASEIQVQKPSSGAANGLIASVRAWFSPGPAAPERVKGNPRRRVWVDLKTGLYYCPGADYYGYGGASRGKAMRQKDAEYEYFQPATGAPCQ